MGKLLILILLLPVSAGAQDVSLISTPVTKVTKSSTTISVENSCRGTSEKFLVPSYMNQPVSNPNGTRRYDLGPMEGSAYPLVICTESICYNYGNLTFLPSRKYHVKISQCNLPGVVIESYEIDPLSKSLQSPKVRFRSRKVGPIEFRHDNSRFRRLSVGMSSYSNVAWPTKENGTKVQFRYRLTSKGPVAYLSTHHFVLRPGYRYFIETEYFGNQKEMLKLQDEGPIPLKKP